ncbi:MAG: HDIG domain-containing protein [Sphaerobacter sp.]|nr:HDIG domain-containing protein [Sphaerobacter sp.]
MSLSPSRPDSQIERAGWPVRRRSGGPALQQVVRLLLFGLCLLAVLVLVLYATWESDALTLKVGQIADRTVKAPRTATFISQTKTEAKRQEAYDDARNVVLRPDPAVAPNQTAALRQGLTVIDTVRADRSQDRARAEERIRGAVEGLTAEEASAIYALTDDSWTRVRQEAERLLRSALMNQIRAEDVAEVKERMLDNASLLLTNSERQLAAALARPFVQANVVVDEERTRAAREAAAQSVEPVYVTVQQGEVIVRDGDPVTREGMEKLEYFQLLSPQETWQQFFGVLGLLTLLTGGLLLYLYRAPHGPWQTRQLVLLGMVVLVPVVVGRFVLSHPDLRYMFPVAASAMLLAILLDVQVAVVVGGAIGLYLGIISGTSYEIAFITFLASVAGAVVIWRADRTTTFVWAGGAVALATSASAMLFTLVSGELDTMRIASLLVDGAVNGALAASLTFLSFSLFGRVFGITTHLQLLELAHPNQPLLYRLAREAPGTYHHSIVVSNLAESAVEVVGGDPLFARVAVLYHDIGKVLRPSFFVENQANRANVHEALDPHTSARIIQEHVSDGVRLARKARLPQPIIDVIQQHHGTTLIKYFYNRALTSGEEVDEAAFRYPGPRPQTKEAGVIMLADSVEAAVRAAAQAGRLFDESADGQSGGERHSTRLAEIVDRVIRERLDDGQLDECDLTLKQIEQVRQTFISILEGIYHPRIEYPELRRVAEPSPRPEAAATEVAS